MIYCGPLGLHSNKVIEYFEGISGVPKIRDNYNPATWMLEVTSTSSEAELGVDFADIYKHSSLYKNNKELAKSMSTPPVGSKPLEFPTRFAQNGWGQFKACLWKQHWSYWRSPSYNLMRFIFMTIASLVFGALFWNQETKINNQQSLFNVLGAMFSALIFCGFNNSSSVLPYVSTERGVVALSGHDADLNDTKLSCGCNSTISFLQCVPSLCWIFDSSTTNPKVVDMVILFKPNILNHEWNVYFPIWRYPQGYLGVWTNQTNSKVHQRLLWISSQSTTHCGCYFNFVPYYFCFSVLIFHLKVKLPKEMNNVK